MMLAPHLLFPATRAAPVLTESGEPLCLIVSAAFPKRKTVSHFCWKCFSGGATSLTTRIAIVEDEPDLREAVAEYLGANGYEVLSAENANAMREIAKSQSFDLAILDIAMPGEDGLSLGRWLRQQQPAGLIYATAAGSPIDRIVGLELGADDYIVKPYELRELLARIRSVLRRIQRETATPVSGLSSFGAPTLGSGKTEAIERRIISFGEFEADLDGRQVTRKNGTPLELARSEFDLLEVFLARVNRMVSRASLSDAMGLSATPDASRAIDIRIMRLRKKIEPDPSSPKFLRTVRGEGYIFTLPAEPSR